MIFPQQYTLKSTRSYMYVIAFPLFGEVEGLHELPREYHPLIAQALENYRGAARHQISSAALDNFTTYLDARLLHKPQ
jgi:hypothetical protein